MKKQTTARIERRRFLRLSAEAALWTALHGRGALAAAAAGTPLGIQMFAMQADLVRDFRGTLEALGRIGYREVEPVGLLGHDVKAYRKALDDAGLSAPSAHIVSKAAQSLFVDMATGKSTPDDAWAKINLAMRLKDIESIVGEMFETSVVLGNEYLVLAETDSAAFQSGAGVDDVIEHFVKVGDLCARHGLKFAFHPHPDGFARVEGVRNVDRILQNTDPAKVFVELDFFWAAMAAVDVPAFLAKYSGRVPLGHIKDMKKGVVVPPDGYKDFGSIPPDPFEDVGLGRLDFKQWLPLAKRAGMRHFFVERDEAPDPLRNAANSYASLRRLLP